MSGGYPQYPQPAVAAPRVNAPRGARRLSNAPLPPPLPGTAMATTVQQSSPTRENALHGAPSESSIATYSSTNYPSATNSSETLLREPSMPEMSMPSPMLTSGRGSASAGQPVRAHDYAGTMSPHYANSAAMVPLSPRTNSFPHGQPTPVVVSASPAMHPYANSPAAGHNVMFAPGAAIIPPPGTVISQDGHIVAMPAHPMASGAAPMRRRKTVKQNIELKGGRLVVDIPVPEKILSFGRYRQGQEFTHLRYTAATCDADQFLSEGYSLRPVQYGRSTELFIVVTMYNEDEHLFTKTMTALFKNIAHLCSRNRSKTWGADGWKKVVVCIVSDGRKKIHPRVLTVLGIMGCYQDGIMKNTVNGREVSAHIFEYTTQVCVDQELKVRGEEKGMVPVQMIFCLKEKNQKKINSHRWFFNAFGQVLQPKVCVLIDVGTRPAGTSIYHLWKSFENDPRVGGACGEIMAELGPGCRNLVNPLVAAQNFEYKMSNILDKPLESCFGFISVLPGAFSAYRFAALQDSYPGVGPLSSYFMGERMHGGGDVFSANMYLAEDRILCFELVTKRNESWLLRYVKAAKAETDVPDSIPEFISQRRRWLNGSFFAGVHALTHIWYVFRSNHSIIRKFVLLIEALYNLYNMLFSWFGLANFYLTFYFLGYAATTSLSDPSQPAVHAPFGAASPIIFEVTTYVYMLIVIVTFILSMGNRPQGSRWTYFGIFVIFALIMMFLTFLAGWTVVNSVIQLLNPFTSVGQLFQVAAFRDIVVSIAATYLIYMVSSLLYLDFWHIFTSMIQYLLLLPSFINVLMIYAFSNLHDVSWGTKGDNSSSTDLGEVVVRTGKDGKQVVEMELPTERQDIDAEYDRLLIELRNRPQAVEQKRDAKTKQEDYFRGFRTRILLWWMLSNLILVLCLTNPYILQLMQPSNSGSSAQSFYNPYLTFIMWSVAGINLIRFVGSVWYLFDNFLWG